MTRITQDTTLIYEATGEYPLFLSDVRQRNPNTCIGSEISSEALVDFGYLPVENVTRPSGDVVVEGAPEKVDGTWKRTWIVRNYDAAEIEAQLAGVKADTLYAIEQLRESQFAKGFAYLFNNGEVYHIQVRDGDRANILSKRTRAKEALEEGRTDYKVVFQVFENVAVTLTAEEMVAMANAADDHVTEGYGVIWGLKDQTNKATQLSEIPELPETIFTT